MEMNELLIKLDYYSECCDKIEEYRGQLVANGLHEAMYMDIQVCVVKYGNRIPNSINIYCDGNHLEDSESCDISELLEIAKNRDPILFRKYKELLKYKDELEQELGPHLEDMKNYLNI